MAEDEDKSSKTEEPSERKLQKAREQGNVPKSREVNNFFMLLAILVTIFMAVPYTMEQTLLLFGSIFSDAGTVSISNKSSLAAYFYGITGQGMKAITPIFIVLSFFALFGALVQTGVLFSAEPIKPKLSKISLIKGLERMFSVKSLMEFFKSVVKLVVVGIIIYVVLIIHSEELLILLDKTVMDGVTATWLILMRIIMAVLAISFVLAVLDFIFMKAQHTKENRMTRKELKDEYKDTEGDPHIKNRQRQIRMERAQAKMMTEIPKSDVVVTNPTHFAVALRYDKAQEAAPRVVGKGCDHLALRIRELAAEHNIPLYEDPPLARKLYYDVEIDEEIPLDLYEAVAQVVAFIYGLKGKKSG